jgi:hypothetical protein
MTMTFKKLEEMSGKIRKCVRKLQEIPGIS